MGKPKDANAYKADIKAQYKESAEKLLAFYPGNSDEEASASQKKLSRDMVFGMQNFAWSNIALKNGAKVFVYRFKRLVPENKEASMYSAFHTGEVPYAYNNLKFVNRPFKTSDHALAKTMSGYWINFIKTGNPNGKNLPEWPAYTKEEQSQMIFDEVSASGKMNDAAALSLLQSIVTKSK
jgi:para-nitrobenzyl esterase